MIARLCPTFADVSLYFCAFVWDNLIVQSVRTMTESIIQEQWTLTVVDILLTISATLYM